MEPDLELVQVCDDQSFKIWAHGYPFRTVRWHFHPEYELHLVTNTNGDRSVGDHIGPFVAGGLVLFGPNLPHNSISDVPAGQTVEERCLVLQFSGAFMANCIRVMPELSLLQLTLQDAFRGVYFEARTAERVGPLMRFLPTAGNMRRIALFMHHRRRAGGRRHRRLAGAALARVSRPVLIFQRREKPRARRRKAAGRLAQGRATAGTALSRRTKTWLRN